MEVAGQTQSELNGIIRPKLGYPVFILQGDSFDAYVQPVQAAERWKASITSEFGSCSLTVESSTLNKTGNFLRLRLKAEERVPGLYSLKITALSTSGAVLAEYSEPNSVSVRSSFQLPFRVMFVTDIHVNDKPDRILNTRRIIRLANLLRPDFILAAGDIIDSAQESYFPIAYELLENLEVPIIMAPGNHDHLASGDFFSKYLAPWYGSLDVGPVHIVTLDSGPASVVGEISASQLVWLRNDLAANGQSEFKILMYHHPMFNPENLADPFGGAYANLGEVYQIASQYGVSLIINGHMHTDIVFHGPVLTLVNSNAYEGGRPYTGFRILTITKNGIEYRYAGEEQQIPLYDLNIDYSQPNDGKSFGIAVKLVNNWKMSVNGSLRLRLAYGEFLKVEGASVSGMANRTDYRILTVPVSLTQGETKMITAYTMTDNEPPVVQSVDFISSEGPTIIVVEFRWIIFDSVLGMKNAEMHYSTDNTTWERTPLIEVEPRVYWVRLQFAKSTKMISYYATASDVQGLNTTSASFSSPLIQPISTSTTGTQSPYATTHGFDILQNAWLLGVLAAVLVITIGAVCLRKRSKQFTGIRAA
jgi:Icc-related predicted phosphoesterase